MQVNMCDDGGHFGSGLLASPSVWVPPVNSDRRRRLPNDDEITCGDVRRKRKRTNSRSSGSSNERQTDDKRRRSHSSSASGRSSGDYSFFVSFSFTAECLPFVRSAFMFYFSKKVWSTVEMAMAKLWDFLAQLFNSFAQSSLNARTFQVGLRPCETPVIIRVTAVHWILKSRLP